MAKINSESGGEVCGYSGEIINKRDLIKIKKIINKKNNLAGYSFLQRTYVKEELPFKFKKIKNRLYKGYTFRRITRLFKNNKRIRFEYPIHETVVNSIRRINGRIQPLDITIDHFPLSKSKKDTNNKNKLYLRLLKKKIRKYQEAKFYCELGMQYLLMKNKKEAKKYLLKAADLNSHYKQFLNI